MRNKPFFIQFDQDPFKKGWIISNGMCDIKVIKVYRNTKFRRFLHNILTKLKSGIDIKLNQIKVKQI